MIGYRPGACPVCHVALHVHRDEGGHVVCVCQNCRSKFTVAEAIRPGDKRSSAQEMVDQFVKLAVENEQNYREWLHVMRHDGHYDVTVFRWEQSKKALKKAKDEMIAAIEAGQTK